MITIESAFSQEVRRLGTIGRQGENNTRQIAFGCEDILTEYPTAQIICALQRATDREAYLADSTMQDKTLIVTMSNADVSIPGTLRVELRAIIGEDIRKSAVYMAHVVASLIGQGDKPGNPVPDSLNRIDETLKSAEETQEKLERSLAQAETVTSAASDAAQSAREVADTVQAKLDNGDFIGPAGKDGKDGEKGPKGDIGATGPQGAPGSDASVTADNIQAALGYTPVKDVQVAGSSVLDGGVANVPIAQTWISGPRKPGVVAPAIAYGLYMSNELLQIYPAEAGNINNRVLARPIVPTNLDHAVKAAMCDGKGAAWTEAEQKAARDRMGIDKAYELIEEITLAEESTVVRTTEPDGTPYNFAVIMLRAEFPAIEKTGNIRLAYYIGNTYNQVISYFLSPYNANAVKYGYSKVWVENGRYRSGWWTCTENSDQFAQYYENPVQQDKYSVADGNIVGINTVVMAAGTKISIYGVRAQ